MPIYRHSEYFEEFWNYIDVAIAGGLGIYFFIVFILTPNGYCDLNLGNDFNILMTVERVCLSISSSLIVLRSLENIANLLPSFGFFVNGFMRILNVIPIFISMLAIISLTGTYILSAFMCAVPDKSTFNSSQCQESKWKADILDPIHSVVQNITQNHPQFDFTEEFKEINDALGLKLETKHPQ